MRMSCNGCRVLRKGCSENCSIRPCLQWIKSPESQANATVFLAKFYGRAGLLNLINAGPQHLRPAIFRSLLYEACGRILNPIYGSVGLLWSGNWQRCQAAVEAVLKGNPITPINSEAAASGQGPPLKPYDIRHVCKDKDSVGSNDAQRVKSRSRFKRSAGKTKKPNKGTELKSAEPEEPRSGCTVCCAAVDEVANRSASHESSLSHQSEEAPPNVETAAEEDSKESDSMVSVETAETSMLFRDEPESARKQSNGADEAGGADVGLELTLGFKPALRETHVMPVKKRKIDFQLQGSGGDSANKKVAGMKLGLECSA
ncbi:LOB domain-containing protein 41 [Neltuma alba]|uniref:LOB domain-containing protein 41 n=1 Tax=Neltuma alba TaxID=207710 RepID=UPI0010A2DA37|nr:LOB domain-containing protein 41-like [Prosopis alba]